MVYPIIYTIIYIIIHHIYIYHIYQLYPIYIIYTPYLDLHRSINLCLPQVDSDVLALGVAKLSETLERREQQVPAARLAPALFSTGDVRKNGMT